MTTVVMVRGPDVKTGEVIGACQGQWVRQPHLDLISQKVASLVDRPLRLIVSMPPRH